MSLTEIIRLNLLGKDYPDWEFQANIVSALIHQGKIEEAIQSYEKGINVDSKFAMTYNNLGLLYFHYKSIHFLNLSYNTKYQLLLRHLNY